jgi:hypothetical protein
MSERTSLPACERLHPGQPSGIEVSLVHKTDGTTYERRICTTCRSAIASSQSRNGKTFGAQAPPLKKRYGVNQLSWAAPEVVLAAEVAAK